MIDRLLTGLKKPYCYNPENTFYSFAKEAWITLPEQRDPEETVQEGVEALIECEAWDELTALKERISEVREDNECEEE